jgi:putative protein-disulfide isomerase
VRAGPLFVYIADPMCSWCYGFAPHLAVLRERFADVPLHVVTGGLRAFETRVMDAELKHALRHHWNEVRRRSGQPFSERLFDRDDFVYDTEPACRAVVAVREHEPARAQAMLHAIQHAFYAEGRDVTRAGVLADVYAGLCARDGDGGFDPETFAAAWASEAIRTATREDFALRRQWGIGGFPTLLAIRDERPRLIAPGYMDAATLIERAAAVLGPR